MQHSAKTWLFRLILLGFSLGFAFICAEMLLRITQPPRPEQLEPVVEHVYVPADPAEGRYASYVHLKPGDSYHLEASVHANSHGLRGPEITDADVGQAIVALGDSHTYGFGVPEEETWPAQLEELLKASGASVSRVINGGIQSLDLPQELMLFEERLLPVSPRTVILAYYWNDMPHPGEPFAPWNGGEMRPFSMEVREAHAGGGEAAKEPGFVEGLKGLLRSSYLIYTVVQKLPAVQAKFFPTPITGWRNAVLEGASSDRIDASWAAVDRDFERLESLSSTHNFRVILLCVPIFEQIVGARLDSDYQRKIEELSAHHSFQFVDPLPAILALNPQYPGDFVPFDGHPTGRIYGAMAEAVHGALYP